MSSRPRADGDTFLYQPTTAAPSRFPLLQNCSPSQSTTVCALWRRAPGFQPLNSAPLLSDIYYSGAIRRAFYLAARTTTPTEATMQAAEEEATNGRNANARDIDAR